MTLLTTIKKAVMLRKRPKQQVLLITRRDLTTLNKISHGEVEEVTTVVITEEEETTVVVEVDTEVTITEVVIEEIIEVVISEAVTEVVEVTIKEITQRDTLPETMKVIN